jgi:hypothetical protein
MRVARKNNLYYEEIRMETTKKHKEYVATTQKATQRNTG